MPTLLERVCCNFSPENCTSRLPHMDQYVLEEGVLRIARTYRREVLVYPEDGDEAKANKHAAYRQFVKWQHGRLGAGVRRVVPSCCVWRIRDTFSDPFGQYTGFNTGRIG
ncbi:P2X purinoceptor 7-like [Dreissena polymorpha]|nr:P2X purinoceptor 7-like [Dreissena polymorpha]